MKKPVESPRVSAILALVYNYAHVPPAILANAARRGTEVHHVCELYDRGELDETYITDEIEPYLTAWKAFCAVEKPIWEHIEVGFDFASEYPHRNYRSEGVDRICVMGGIKWLLDLKTVYEASEVLKRVWALQISAYAHGFGDLSITHVGIVHLKKNRTYDFHDFSMGMEKNTEDFLRLVEAWHVIDSIQ